MRELNKAIVTLCIGKKYEKFKRVTHVTFEKYANLINADFVVIDRPKLVNLLNHPHFEKLQIYDLFEKYDRLLFVDSDILITPNCPDIFQLVPYDCFGAYYYSKFTNAHDSHIREVQDVLGNIGWKADCFNSGVMVLSKKHKVIFDPHSDLLKKWVEWRKYNKGLIDQPYLNYMVEKLHFQTYDIGYKFNHTTATKNSQERFKSFIIHYPGSGHSRGGKFIQVLKDKFIMENRLFANFMADHPGFCAFLDSVV